MAIDSVLLVGGSGFLGLHLVQEFYKVEPRPKITVFDVRPLPSPLASYFTFKSLDIEFIKGDITSADDVNGAISSSGCSVVVHSASPVHGLGQEIYEKVNVQGTKNLIKCCSAAKAVKALVYTSSAGVIFNGQDIHNADESWPIPEVPMDGYNETKAIAEAAVLDANNSSLRTVALRPAGIFGPGDRQLVPGLLNVSRLGQSKFQIGDNNNLFDWTYAGNVAHAHVLAAEKLLQGDKNVEGKKFFITNDAPTYFWTLARTVWKADGHIDSYNIVLSRPVAIAIGYLLEFFSKLVGKEPGLTPFRVKIVCAYRYHNIARAKEFLGYKPLVGLEDGINYTLDWMKETKA